MRFVTMKDLRSKTTAIRKDLAADGEIVVTAIGRPITLLAAVEHDNLEQELLARRRARAALERTGRIGWYFKHADAEDRGSRRGRRQGAKAPSLNVGRL